MTHPEQLATHILKTDTTGEDLRVTRHATVVSISGTSATADRKARSVYSAMVTISSCLNLNLLKIYSPSNVSVKRMDSVPKNSVPSQHSRRSNKYKIEQPLLSGI